ncbi:MAG: hypothetical protein C0444_07415 [Microbacterium sp.]|nr:hypothetical protein [Microbacterium sp.]MBA4346144.1 hypothetical protein [Microbacterium sp.]
MHIWKRWVFPIIGLVIATVIAVSVAKLAFFPDEQSSAEQPWAQISDPVVSVERGSLVNQLALTGTIARDETYPLKSAVSGTVTTVHVGNGAVVSAGQVLFTVRLDTNRRLVDIVAPEAGSLSELALVAGQSTTVGEEIASLSPQRFHVLSTVEPVQLYRLIDAPTEATVTITGGPAPFACTGLTTQVADDGTTSVRCSVPGDQVVFPGLPVQLVVDVGAVDDVLVIPTTAVKGGAGSGLVWLDSGDGSEPVEREVTLGISDGSMVEVIDGLAQGDLIRQFVPGVAAPVEEICYEIAPGEQYCETGVSW